MFRNYFSIALRNLLRSKLASVVSIGGLALALATSLLIGLFIFDESGYDTQNVNADRLFRLVRTESVLTAGPMGPALQNGLAGIEAATHIDVQGDAAILLPNGKRFTSPVHFADSTYFRMFSHRFIQGQSAEALPNAESVVVSRSAAITWFGTADVLGDRFEVDLGDEVVPVVVTGVIEDVPERTHFHFDLMMSFEIVERATNRMGNWTTNWLYTYVLAAPGVKVADLNERLQPFMEEQARTDLSTYRLQAVPDIHLGPTLSYEMEPQGSFQTVATLGLIAFLILGIACANFVNMVMSRTSERLREIGMRRTVGAHRRQLIGQFLGESVGTVLLAGCIGWATAILGLPLFNDISGNAWTWHSLSTPSVLFVYLTGLAFVGMTAGLYPSLTLSSLRTVSALKGRLPSRHKGLSVQSISLSAQFAVSMFLIVATLVAARQMSYMADRDLGFQKDARLVVPVENDLLAGREEETRHRLEALPGVRSVSFTDSVPGEDVSDFLFRPEGDSDPEDRISFDTWFTDESIVETLDLKVVDGRAFDAQNPTDRSGFLLNESAVQALAASISSNWSDPLEKRIDFMVPGENGWAPIMSGPVIGVVQDFNYRSLHESVGPLAFIVVPQTWDTAVFELDTDDFGQTTAAIQATLTALGSTRGFEFSFLDDQLDALYRAELRMQKLSSLFMVLAIILACLGLFAQAAHAVQVRRREIGVRKVFGASINGIARRFVGRYVLLVAASALVAIPVSYVLLGRWLDRFAYRIDLTVGLFVTAALLTVGLAVVSVLFQAVRAAWTNPAVVLKGD